MQDYSAHKINAHKRLKEVHLLMLKNKYDEAVCEVDEAIVELRMMKAAITDLKEQQSGEEDGSV
jgi:hypothetical protein